MSCPALLLLANLVSVPARIDTDPGLSVSPPATVATSSSAPAVAAQGSSFVATWLGPGQDPDSSCIMAAHLDGSGRPLAEPRVLACVLRAGVQRRDPKDPQLLRPWLTASPAVAATTGAALVVWGEGSRLVGAVWRGDAIVRFSRELSQQPNRLEVDFDGEAFVVEWSDYDHVFVDRVTIDGQLAAAAPSAVVDRAGSGGIEDSALACVAGTCLVTFEHFYGNSRTTGGGALVTKSGVGPVRSYGGNPFDVGALRLGSAGLVALMNSYGSVVGEPSFGTAQGFTVLAAPGERIRDIRGAGEAGNALLVWQREWQRGRASAVRLVRGDAGASMSRPTNLDGAVHPTVATTDGTHFLVLAERHERQDPPAVVAYAVAYDSSKEIGPPSPRPVVAPGVVRDASAPALMCLRATDSCWDCASIQFPDEVPGAARPACNGLTVLTAKGERCARLERQCCPGGACEQPPLSSPCKAECGDSTGDRKNDRCLVPSSCPYKTQLEDSLGHYRVSRPAALFAAVCGPLPTSFPDDLASAGDAACGPENVTWTIHPDTMARGGGGGGPGLCYGVVRVGREGQTVHRCGAYHCQTLRWCDGRERAQYCTVLAGCQEGHVVPTGLTW